MKKIKKCDVCKNEVYINEFGYGKCKFCGWIDDLESKTNPNKLVYPNITSLNNAIELNRKGLKIKPTFEDFIKSVELNYEPSFKFNKKKYGVTNFSGYEFFEWDKEEGYQNYKTIEEFAKNVNINGELLKEIWSKVYQFEFGC